MCLLFCLEAIALHAHLLPGADLGTLQGAQPSAAVLTRRHRCRPRRDATVDAKSHCCRPDGLWFRVRRVLFFRVLPGIPGRLQNRYSILLDLLVVPLEKGHSRVARDVMYLRWRGGIVLHVCGILFPFFGAPSPHSPVATSSKPQATALQEVEAALSLPERLEERAWGQGDAATLGQYCEQVDLEHEVASHDLLGPLHEWFSRFP